MNRDCNVTYIRIGDAPQKHHPNLIKKCYFTEPGVSWFCAKYRNII